MRARRRLSLALALCALVAVIGLLQPTGFFAPFDERAMNLAGRLRLLPGAGFITWASIWLDRFGSAGGRSLIALTLAMFLARAGRPHLVIWLIVAALGTALANPLVKLIFAAPRPDIITPAVVTTGLSFPSGHSAGAMALYGAVALLFPRRLVIALCAAMILATGASRVWLGVHWPSDVVGGWAVGLAWLALISPLLPAGRRLSNGPAFASRGSDSALP